MRILDSNAKFDGNLDSAIDHCLISDIMYNTMPQSGKLLTKLVRFAKAAQTIVENPIVAKSVPVMMHLINNKKDEPIVFLTTHQMINLKIKKRTKVILKIKLDIIETAAAAVDDDDGPEVVPSPDINEKVVQAMRKLDTWYNPLIKIIVKEASDRIARSGNTVTRSANTITGRDSSSSESLNLAMLASEQDITQCYIEPEKC